MAVTPLTVRRMEVADVPAVLTLERQIFPTPWTADMLGEELRGPGRVYCVVEESGGIVAYGGVMVVEQDAHVMNLAVVPAARRRGLATALLLQLIDEALDMGASHVTLELRVSNRPARALYEKFGFTPVGVRPRYYANEDALVMWALDVDGAEFAARLTAIRREAA